MYQSEICWSSIRVDYKLEICNEKLVTQVVMANSIHKNCVDTQNSYKSPDMRLSGTLPAGHYLVLVAASQ